MATTQAEIEQLLNGVSMGDPDAIRQVADFIYDRQRAKSEPSPERRAQDYLAAEQIRQRSLQGWASFQKTHRDVADDPERWALAKKADTQLAEKFPNMDPVERMQRAGDYARDAIADPEVRDNAGAIAKMRKARAGQLVGMEDDDEAPTRDDPDDYDAAVSEGMQQLKAGRLGREVSEQNELPRPARRFPFAAR